MTFDAERAAEVLAETLRQITADHEALDLFEEGQLVVTLSTHGVGVWGRGQLAAALVDQIHADGGSFEMVDSDEVADRLGDEAERFLEEEE